MSQGPPAAPPDRRIRLILPPIVRFAITGAANSVVGFAVLLVALWLGYSDVAANFIGFAVGLTVGFFINRQWTFAVEGRVGLAEVMRYLLGFCLAWLLNITVVLIGIRLGFARSPLIHLAGIAAYSLAFFFISRSFVFAPSAPALPGARQGYLGELIVIPATAVLMLIMRHLPLTHDVVWQLWIARQILGGSALYTQINEINPPLWFWMAMPLQQVASALDLPAATVLVWSICLLGLAAALLVGRIGAFEGERERAWAMVATLVIGLFTSLYDFGQREQILLIVSIPYALLIAARLRGAQPAPLLAISIAVFASFGFALKHYFVLAPLGLEALLLWHWRWSYRPVRPETLVLAVLGSVYIAAIVVLTPGFLSIMVPMVQTAYSGFETPLAMWFDEPVQAFWIFGVAVFFIVGGHRLAHDRPEFKTLALCALAFFVGYLLQRKGWQYHSIATSGLLLMLLASYGFAKGQRLADLRAQPLLYVCIVLHLGFSFAERPYANEREDIVAPYIEQVPEGAPVLIIASNPMWGWPAVEKRRRLWASRYGAHWMLPAIGRARADHTDTPAMRALERTVRSETLADLLCTAPALIFVENREPNFVTRPIAFNTLQFFMQDKPFREYLAANYRLAANGVWLRAYLRTTAAPPARPLNCRPIVPPYGTE